MRVEVWKEIDRPAEGITRQEDGRYYIMDYSLAQSYPMHGLTFKLSEDAPKRGDTAIDMPSGYYIGTVSVVAFQNGDSLVKIMLRMLKKKVVLG